MALTQISTQGIKNGTITGTDLAASFATTGDFNFTGDNANILFDKDNDNIRVFDNASIDFGQSGDLKIHHTGNVNIIDDVQSKSISIQRAGSEQWKFGDGTFQAPDNKKIQLGNAQDLEIYHDGSHSRIDETGTGNLMIQSNNAVFIKKGTSEDIARFNVDGAVELLYDGTKRFETTDAGIAATGDVQLTNFLKATGDLLLCADIDNDNSGTALRFCVDGDQSAEKMRIDENGNVGIGTTSPSDELTIRGSQFQTSQISIGDNGDRFRIGYVHSDGLASSTTASQIVSTSGSDLYIAPASNAASEIHFFSNASSGAPTERMRIDSSGNVGIGISPQRTLHQHENSSAANYHLFTNTGTGSNSSDGGIVGIDASENLILWNQESTNLRFATNNSERMRITADGPHLLLGGTDDVNEITESSANAGMVIGGTGFGNAGLAIITSTSGTGRLYFGDNTGNDAGRNRGQINYGHSDDHMRFATAGSERMRIDSSGRLLAGSTTTANSGRIQGFIAHGSTAGESGITSVDTTSMAAGVGGEIAFYGKTSSSGYNYLGHVRGIKENGTDSNTACALTFHTRPTLTAPQERMRIDSAGAVRIGHTTFTADTGADDLIVGSGNSGANRGITILNHTGQDGRLCFGQSGDPDAGMIKYSHGSDVMQFFVESSEKMRIASNGDVDIADAVGQTHAAKLAVEHSGINPNAIFALSSHGSFQGATLQSNASRNTTNGSYIHFKCAIHGVADKFRVLDNGNCANTNNSFSSLSDVNLKENIVDAGSQWNDIKNIRVRKFNFKEGVDPEKPTLLGVIAQEAELVCPNLIETDVQLQAGEEKEYKSFKYSVLYMKAIKCLQEAMAKIEVLETEVAALKAA